MIYKFSLKFMTQIWLVCHLQTEGSEIVLWQLMDTQRPSGCEQSAAKLAASDANALLVPVSITPWLIFAILTVCRRRMEPNVWKRVWRSFWLSDRTKWWGMRWSASVSREVKTLERQGEESSAYEKWELFIQIRSQIKIKMWQNATHAHFGRLRCAVSHIHLH